MEGLWGLREESVQLTPREPAEALLTAGALPQAKLPTAEWNLSLAGPGSLSALSRGLTPPILALAWLMENEQGVLLKAACSPLWGLLACLLEGQLQLGSLGIPGS